MITRRALLAGAGISVGLPFLPSLAPKVRAADAPKRLVVWYIPNGFIMRDWIPAATGPGYALSPVLTPLASVKADVSVISGLDNMPGEQGVGDHPMGTGAFLTAAKVNPTNGSNVRAAVSMDQVAAAAIAGSSAGHIRSLQLGVEGSSRGPTCDFYTCTYTDNISWSSPTTPMPKTTDPRVVFDRLFAGLDPNQSRAEAERRQALDRSVLDYVLEESGSLQKRLGTKDRAKLDEYFTSVREVEMRIAGLPGGATAGCAAPLRPAADLDLTKRIDVMSDLMVLALACDRTRVITFMVGNGATERSHPFLTVDGRPITDAYHPLTHSAQNDSWRKKINEISRWEIERFAYFVAKMKATQEPGGGSLLDSSIVFLSSEMSDPATHAHNDMPVLLAGKVVGASRLGSHHRTKGTFGQLYVTMLNALGAPVTKFGDDGDRALVL